MYIYIYIHMYRERERDVYYRRLSRSRRASSPWTRRSPRRPSRGRRRTWSTRSSWPRTPPPRSRLLSLCSFYSPLALSSFIISLFCSLLFDISLSLSPSLSFCPLSMAALFCCLRPLFSPIFYDFYIYI